MNRLKVLFVGIILTTPNIWAENYYNANAKVIDYSNYDYEAGCDFILARFQEVETELADAQKLQVKLLKVEKLPYNNTTRQYKYTGKSVNADFVVTNSKKLVLDATLDYAKSHESRTKDYIFARLGIKNVDKDDAIEIGCDALSAELFFDPYGLKTVVIKSNFID